MILVQNTQFKFPALIGKLNCGLPFVHIHNHALAKSDMRHNQPFSQPIAEAPEFFLGK